MLIKVFKMQLHNYGTVEALVQRKDVESQSSKPSCTKNRLLWWRVAIDVPLLLIVGAVIGLFELGVIPSHKWGFYCNDPKLSFNYTGDTVTTSILMSTLFILPLNIVFVTEYIFINLDGHSKKRLKKTIKNSIWIYIIYIYGLLINLCIVEVMKGVVGAPRPIFFDLCEPDTAKTCNGSEFVYTFECTSTKYTEWLQLDSSRSFPSGHTSLSVFCGFFIGWYLQKRAFNWSYRTIFLVPVLQILCVTYAAICSLTRITDHLHHWWDVLFGAVVGIVTLYYTIIISDNFSYVIKKSDSQSDEAPQSSKNILFDERQS